MYSALFFTLAVRQNLVLRLSTPFKFTSFALSLIVLSRSLCPSPTTVFPVVISRVFSIVAKLIDWLESWNIHRQEFNYLNIYNVMYFPIAYRSFNKWKLSGSSSPETNWSRLFFSIETIGLQWNLIKYFPSGIKLSTSS